MIWVRGHWGLRNRRDLQIRFEELTFLFSSFFGDESLDFKDLAPMPNYHTFTLGTQVLGMPAPISISASNFYIYISFLLFPFLFPFSFIESNHFVTHTRIPSSISISFSFFLIYLVRFLSSDQFTIN